MSRLIAAILLASTVTASYAATAEDPDDELEGSVSVVSNRVIVKAMRKTPAAGTRVRLMRGNQIIDEGTIDQNGFWLGAADKVGAYEIWLGSSTNDDDILKMPVSVTVVRSENDGDTSWLPPCCRLPARTSAVAAKPAASQDTLPYFTASLGVCLLLGAGAVFYSTRARKRPPAAEWHGEFGETS